MLEALAIFCNNPICAQTPGDYSHVYNNAVLLGVIIGLASGALLGLRLFFARRIAKPSLC
jgi:hypothetical protein